MTSKPLTETRRDYQVFTICGEGHIENIGERMRAKLEAIPFPDLTGKTVLDVGCDMGFWSFMAADAGAKRVVGLDRNRPVGGSHADLIAKNRESAERFPKFKNCIFENVNIGKQWKEFGRFDVIFLFSLYHHIFENCGDHRVIWFWLWRQCAPGAEVIWENPIDVTDGVAHSNISKEKHPFYTKDAILSAAAEFFNVEYIGPALHEPTRSVYRFRPRAFAENSYRGKIEAGAGGASKAFDYAEGRMASEIERLLGFKPFPGSFNIKLEAPFDFGRWYYPGTLLDVRDRAAGLESAWGPRACRFYPVKVNDVGVFAMRFEGEDYPANFVEIIASHRLRDIIEGDRVILER